MKKNRKLLCLLLALCMVLSVLPVSAAAAGEEQSIIVTQIDNPNFDTPWNQKPNDLKLQNCTYKATDIVSVIIILKDRSLLNQGFKTEEIADMDADVCKSEATLRTAQDTVRQQIETQVLKGEELAVEYYYSVVANGMAVEIPYGKLNEIRALPEVKSAFVAPKYELPKDMTPDTVQPDTYSSGQTVGAPYAWESGYTGKGMRIAIIDSGLDIYHPSFSADNFPEDDDYLTETEIGGVLDSLNAYNYYEGEGTLLTDDLYYSSKIPYTYNYLCNSTVVEHDEPTADHGDHGTHVAGIAAANELEDTTVKGMAPDAQILVMKVFGRHPDPDKDGGGRFVDIFAAIEDAFRLNADVINMSLGSPAGFTSEDGEIDALFQTILDSDMIVSVSAGNSYSAAYNNPIGYSLDLTSNPDNGIVGAPSTYIGCTTVASVDNVLAMLSRFTVDEQDIFYSDSAAMGFCDTLLEAGEPSKDYPFVVIPGYGEPEDFDVAKVQMGEDASFEGKIALISRGELAFVEKQENAYNAGCIACIVYNNRSGALANMMDGEMLPNVFITQADGQYMLGKADETGVGTLTVKTGLAPTENSTAGLMSDFSSWGVTPDLRLKPDVTAPGGSIYSTRYNDVSGESVYGNMSGTSMAAPHIAGMAALVLEYLREEYPEMSDHEMHVVAEALLMSTAQPITDEYGDWYSPRKQGSGLANVHDAVTAPAYLTVDDATPKVSMGDDPYRTGEYTFTFEVNNISDTDYVYLMDTRTMTEYAASVPGLDFMIEAPCILDPTVQYNSDAQMSGSVDMNRDGKVDTADVRLLLNYVNGIDTPENMEDYNFNEDSVVDTADVQAFLESVNADEYLGSRGVAITIAAGSTTTVTVVITLSEDDLEYMEACFENGIYVDGFVRLYAVTDGACDLSLPFMGFYGDWSDAPVFDSGFWYEDDDRSFYSRYPHVLWTYEGVLGVNPIIGNEPYDESCNSINPELAGHSGFDEIYLGLMRNCRELTFAWEDADGNVLWENTANYVSKSYYRSNYGVCLPFLYNDYMPYMTNPDPFMFMGLDGEWLENGTPLNFVVRAWLDDGDKIMDDEMSFPVIVDYSAPIITETDGKLDIVCRYDEKTHKRTLDVTVQDNVNVAGIAILPPTSMFATIPVADSNGEPFVVSIDVTDYGTDVELVLADFAFNINRYAIHFEVEDIGPFDSVYAYYMNEAENSKGWCRFDKEDSRVLYQTADYAEAEMLAAEYLDGYIVGVDADSNIVAMQAEDREPVIIGRLAFDPDGEDETYDEITFTAEDMSFDYENEILYCLANDGNEASWLLTIDWLTGAVTSGIPVMMLPPPPMVPTDTAEPDNGITVVVKAIAAYRGGTLYGLGSDGWLVRIDPEYGYIIPTDINLNTTIGESASMTFDLTNENLYWTSVSGANYFLNSWDGESQLKTYNWTINLSCLMVPSELGETTLYPAEELAGLIPSMLTAMPWDCNEDGEYQLLGYPDSTYDLTVLPVPYWYQGDYEIRWAVNDTVLEETENTVQVPFDGTTLIITAQAVVDSVDTGAPVTFIIMEVCD